MRSGDFEVAVVIRDTEFAGRVDGTVPVPFGAEYKLRFRTHNGRRAVARVWIDEIQITQGGLIVPAHRYVDLETPPASPGARFRFASTDSDAADAAGKGGPDTDGTKGLIRVEFEAERPLPYVRVRDEPPRRRHPDHPYAHYLSGHSDRDYEKTCSFGPSASASPIGFADASPPDLSELSSGVTVAGSHSSQTFTTEAINTDGVVVTVLLKLRGYVRRASHASHTDPSAYSPLPRMPQPNRCPHCGRIVNVLSKICECGART